MYLRLLAVIVGLGAVAAATPVQARPSQDAFTFITADRSVECVAVDAQTAAGYVDCVFAKALDEKTTPVTHDLYPQAHRHWMVLFSGPGLEGGTRRGLGSRPTRVLRLGGVLTAGFFRCTSTAAGLRCISRHSGHGFVIGQATQKTF